MIPIRRLRIAIFATALALAPIGAGRALAADVANDDAYTHLEDQALSVAAPGVLDNDVNDGGAALCVLGVTTPGLETFLTVEEDGSLEFEFLPDAHGVTTFEYEIGEVGAGGCEGPAADTAEVRITTESVNDPPTIDDVGDCADGSVTVAEDSGAYDEACVAFDSAGPNEDEQTLQEWVVVAEGTVGMSSGPTITESGRLRFTPAANDSGTVNLSIRARDSGGTANGGTDLSNEIEVTITVTPVNDAPVAVADTFFALANRTLNVGAPGVLINDSDIDDASITAVKVSNPSHGVVTLAADGSFSYTPADGYTGPDAFSYRASDGSATSPARVVTLSVSTVPPINTPTPFPSVVPSTAPTPVPTIADPSASPEASASLDPGASVVATPAPSAAASLEPGATPAPDPSTDEGGISLPVLLVGLLLVLLLAFGAAVYVPKWLKAQQTGEPMDDG